MASGRNVKLYADIFSGLDRPVGSAIYIGLDHVKENTPALLYGAGAISGLE